MEDNDLPTSEQVNEVLGQPEQPVDEFPDLSTEEKALIPKVIATITPAITQKANEIAEARHGKQLEQELIYLKAEQEKALQEFYKQNKPLEPAEIATLLSQEYMEFPVKLPNGKKDCVIRELTQAAEMRFLRSLKKNLVPHLQAISAIEWEPGGTVAGNLQRLIDVIPELSEVVAEACALCLDSSGKEITTEWVGEHLSTFRIMAILQAQIQVGRYRDFFSHAARVMQTMKMA